MREEKEALMLYCPKELAIRIRKAAGKERRSVSGQMIYLIERGLGRRKQEEPELQPPEASQEKQAETVVEQS